MLAEAGVTVNTGAADGDTKDIVTQSVKPKFPDPHLARI